MKFKALLLMPIAICLLSSCKLNAASIKPGLYPMDVLYRAGEISERQLKKVAWFNMGGLYDENWNEITVPRREYFLSDYFKADKGVWSEMISAYREKAKHFPKFQGMEIDSEICRSYGVLGKYYFATMTLPSACAIPEDYTYKPICGYMFRFRYDDDCIYCYLPS